MKESKLLQQWIGEAKTEHIQSIAQDQNLKKAVEGSDTYRKVMRLMDEAGLKPSHANLVFVSKKIIINQVQRALENTGFYISSEMKPKGYSVYLFDHIESSDSVVLGQTNNLTFMVHI